MKQGRAQSEDTALRQRDVFYTSSSSGAVQSGANHLDMAPNASARYAEHIKVP